MELSSKVLNVVSETIEKFASENYQNINKEASSSEGLHIEKLAEEDLVYMKNKLSPLGIRLEDDVVITKEAAEVIDRLVDILSAEYEESHMQVSDKVASESLNGSGFKGTLENFRLWLKDAI